MFNPSCNNVAFFSFLQRTSVKKNRRVLHISAASWTLHCFPNENVCPVVIRNWYCYWFILLFSVVCHFSKAKSSVLNVHTCHTAYLHVKRVINMWYQNSGINHVFFFLMKQLQASVAKMATNENICSINSCFRSSGFEKKKLCCKGLWLCCIFLN